MKEGKLEIKSDSPYPKKCRVLVDGFDISHTVREIHLMCNADNVIKAYLELIPHKVDIDVRAMMEKKKICKSKQNGNNKPR